MNQLPQRAQFWQVVRYLLVGGFNTCFGYALFVAFNYLFRALGVYGSEIASLLSNIVAITVAFLGYKWFVFRTRGNYLREWLRTLTVYGASVAFSTLALAPLVGLIRHTTRYQSQAPYIAGAVVAILTVLSSFFGHRHFSFRKTSPAHEDRAQTEQ